MLRKDKEILRSYDDITIIPAPINNIESRSDCNPFLSDGFLPIFTAPMSTVCGEKSWKKWEDNHIIPIIPRSVEKSKRLEFCLEKGKWTAFSLQEFEDNFVYTSLLTTITPKVLIDVANGHMKKIYELVRAAKNKNNLEIMIGNIANPKTIKWCCEAGVDYVRCGIGSGSGCITSSNTAIHYPMASLISDIYQEREEYLRINPTPHAKTKIIADGGIRGYGDVIKALALGADYVMIGGLFAQCLEAEGECSANWNVPPVMLDSSKGGIPDIDISTLKYERGKFYQTLPPIPAAHIFSPYDVEVDVWRNFYGMASKKGQVDISGTSKKTAEGIEKKIQVSITISHWVENMISYLRSAMSYCGIRSVKSFCTYTICYPISMYSKESINK